MAAALLFKTTVAPPESVKAKLFTTPIKVPSVKETVCPTAIASLEPTIGRLLKTARSIVSLFVAVPVLVRVITFGFTFLIVTGKLFL